MPTATRLCRHCKQRQRAETMTSINGAWYCSMEHAIAYGREQGRKLQERKVKAERKQSKAEVKAFRENDRQHQLKLTQAAVNKLCLLLDKGLPCISCGRPDGGPGKRNASHFKSRGSNSFLRFSLANVHASCVVCNLHQSGNIEGYRQGLTERHGSAMVNYLDSAPRVADWQPLQLQNLRKLVSAEIRRIESGEKPLWDWRAFP